MKYKGRIKGLRARYGLNRPFNKKFNRLEYKARNHAYNKEGDKHWRYHKSMARKWKNPKVGLRRKRYYR